MKAEGVRSVRPAVALFAMLAAGALGACTSTQDVLEPSAITPPPAGVATADSGFDPLANAQAGAVPSPSAGATASVPTAAGATLSAVRLQFAPIVGTSVEAATSLSGRLTTHARDRGIRVVGRTDSGATHMLRGYFTPLIEGRDATVVYVWDVYDPAGNRVHRISGQEKTTAGSGTGWEAVPPATMQAIGDATIDQFASWLAMSG